MNDEKEKILEKPPPQIIEEKEELEDLMNNDLKDRIKMPINVYLWNKIEKDDEVNVFFVN